MMLVIVSLASLLIPIAFPKNTSGRDVMINSPSEIDKNQLKELGL